MHGGRGDPVSSTDPFFCGHDPRGCPPLPENMHLGITKPLDTPTGKTTHPPHVSPNDGVPELAPHWSRCLYPSLWGSSPTSFVQKLCGIPGTPSGMRPSSITASPMRTCRGRPSGTCQAEGREGGEGETQGGWNWEFGWGPQGLTLKRSLHSLFFFLLVYFYEKMIYIFGINFGKYR